MVRSSSSFSTPKSETICTGQMRVAAHMITPMTQA